jgi:uncharacterized membrane protein YphA (DoxX/SURF4 family)
VTSSTISNGSPLTPALEAARRAKWIARTALGLVWVYEGLVPKLLYTTRGEIDLVERSGLYWPTPAATLYSLGVGEILGGIWLLTGRAERVAAGISLGLLLVVGTLCAIYEPGLLHHPYGGMSKNLGLIACALIVYLLSRVMWVPSPAAGNVAATRDSASHFADAKAAPPAHRQCNGNLPTSPPSDNSRAAEKVTWLTRAALALVAFAGTAAYAASFRIAGAGEGAAAAVGVAAAVAWPAFGAALLCLTRGRPSAGAWLDACLLTMAAGVAVLTAAAGFNVITASTGDWMTRPTFVASHVALLLAGNALMGTVFVRRARRLGLGAGVAIATWLAALDVPFVLILTSLAVT